jgi:hypothetical protein
MPCLVLVDWDAYTAVRCTPAIPLQIRPNVQSRKELHAGWNFHDNLQYFISISTAHECRYPQHEQVSPRPRSSTQVAVSMGWHENYVVEVDEGDGELDWDDDDVAAAMKKLTDRKCKV